MDQSTSFQDGGQAHYMQDRRTQTPFESDPRFGAKGGKVRDGRDGNWPRASAAHHPPNGHRVEEEGPFKFKVSTLREPSVCFARSASL